MSVALREVTIANHYPRLRLDRRALTRAIHTLDTEFSKLTLRSILPSKIEKRKSEFLSCPPGELSLVFLSDPALARLHADFLNDPTATDVITFEGNPALGVAGEVCVSVDAALRHLAPRATSATRPRSPSRNVLPSLRKPSAFSTAFGAELLLYVVHGWLHLAGYDDLQPAKKRRMRRAEARALRLLGPLRLFVLR